MRLQADHFSTPTFTRGNRRASPRLPADRLRWVERVRLEYGPAVDLIDLSVHGAYFEVDAPLRFGDETKFEIVAEDRQMLVTGRIVRTEISGLRANAVRYRGACEFTRALPWAHRLSWAAAPDDSAPGPLEIDEAADYQPWSGWSEVCLTFRHGRQLRGFTRGFHPSRSAVDVWPSRTASGRERQAVPLSLLRTVVFTRDLDEDGRPVHDGRTDAGAMHPVEVAFRNNDLLLGATPGYSEGAIGLWVLPLQGGDHARVFAVASSVRDIRLF